MEKLKKEVEKRESYDLDFFINEIEACYTLEDKLLKDKESIKKALKEGEIVLVSLAKDEGLYFCKENYKIYYVTTIEDELFEDEDVIELHEISTKEADEFIENYINIINNDNKRIEKIEEWINDIA